MVLNNLISASMPYILDVVNGWRAVILNDFCFQYTIPVPELRNLRCTIKLISVSTIMTVSVVDPTYGIMDHTINSLIWPIKSKRQSKLTNSNN